MSIFQFLLIIGVIALVIFGIRLLPGDKSLAIKRIFGVLIGVFAVLAILFPDLVTTVANAVGIGRGTDLLLYLFIIFVMFLTLSIMRAKARTDARVTDLARAVALMEARIIENHDVIKNHDDETQQKQ
ncbi:MAG TPA: DUF2304 domain-containing protein [Microbacteriaceae bacterium]|nr:DUF2304 domain-containing protein [Microbacteriaceae bacterium]